MGCFYQQIQSCTTNPTTRRNIQFFYGHGQFSRKLYDEILATCTQSALEDGSYASKTGCKALIDKMWTAIGGFYPYNLYDECLHKGPYMADSDNRLSAGVAGAVNDYKCGGTEALTAWVQRADVRKALHVPANAHSRVQQGNQQRLRIHQQTKQRSFISP